MNIRRKRQISGGAEISDRYAQLGREAGRGPMGSAGTSGSPDNSRIPVRTPLVAGIHDLAASKMESSAAAHDRLNWDRELFDEAIADIQDELMELWIGGDYLSTQKNRDQLKSRLFDAWQQAGVVDPLSRWMNLTAEQKFQWLEGEDAVGGDWQMIAPVVGDEMAQRNKTSLDNTITVLREMFPKLRTNGRKRAKDIGLFLRQYSRELNNPDLNFGRKPLAAAEQGESDKAGIVLTLRFIALLFWAAWEKHHPFTHGRVPFADCISDLFPKLISGETGIGLSEIKPFVFQVAAPLRDKAERFRFR